MTYETAKYLEAHVLGMDINNIQIEIYGKNSGNINLTNYYPEVGLHIRELFLALIYRDMGILSRDFTITIQKDEDSQIY